MAPRLLHMVDELTPEDGLRQLLLLLQRLPLSEFRQELLILGRRPALLDGVRNVPVHAVGRRLGWPVFAGLGLRRLLNRLRPDLVHAWSGAALAATRLAWSSRAEVAATISDPAEARAAGRWWRSLPEASSTACIVSSSATSRRRLVEAGVPTQATTVIRPGVDFGALRAAPRDHVRRQCGLPADARVFLTPSPPSRAGGHYYALWSLAILHQLWPGARLVIPGESREQRRLLRLIRNIYCPETYVPVGNRYSPAELLSASDYLLVPAVDDIPTGWLAWAMAASVPIIGSAVPAVAELIADRHNGFLCRPGEPHTLAIRIRTVVESGELARQCARIAYGQAYDVFRTQACVQQYGRLFGNLLAGRDATAGVRDTALDT